MSKDNLFIDANIPMYAIGRPHPLKLVCQQIVAKLADMPDALTDSEVHQEILYRYWAQGERERGIRLDTHFMTIVPTILPVTRRDIESMLALASQHPLASPRDLLHVAVMLNNDIQHILSADQHFDDFSEIERIAPESFVL